MTFVPIGGTRARVNQFQPRNNIIRTFAPPTRGGGSMNISFQTNYNTGLGKAAKYSFFGNLFANGLTFFAGLMPWNKGRDLTFQGGGLGMGGMQPFGMGGMQPFGMGGFTPFGMNMGMGLSPFQQLNSFGASSINHTGFGQVQGAGDPNLAKLQNIFSQYKVMPDSDGKYIVTKGDGKIEHRGTFEEIMAKIDGNKKTDTTTGTTTPGSSTPGSSTPGSSTPGSSTPVSEEPQGINGFTAVKADTLKAGTDTPVIVHDDGKPKDIQGKTTIGEIATEGTGKGFPKTITVSGHTYTFEKLDDKGAPWYKSNDGGQSYRLEQKDGNFQLNQHEGDEGYNIADIRSRASSSSQRARRQQPAQQPAASQAPAQQAPRPRATTLDSPDIVCPADNTRVATNYMPPPRQPMA